MKLNKIKCVVLDFDNTMYSYGEWANEDILTERFLHEQNLLPGIENKVEYLSKLYPQYHIIQFVFAYLHDNNIDDSAFRKFNNENISEIRKPETVFIKPEIIKEISKKYKLFINEEEFEGEYTIREFIDIFSERYGENFTRQGIETSVKRNTLYKNKYKFKLVK